MMYTRAAKKKFLMIYLDKYDIILEITAFRKTQNEMLEKLENYHKYKCRVQLSKVFFFLKPKTVPLCSSAFFRAKTGTGCSSHRGLQYIS